MAPRPILKARLPSFTQRSPTSSSCNSPLPSRRPSMLSPHVHFPPTPVIASTQPAHSPGSYDRSAIAISPNSCELPERGGRVYSQADPHHTPPVIDGYFDPMAFRACTAALEPDAPPLLIPDASSSSCSESDDSDTSLCSPTSIPYSPTHTSFQSIPSTYAQEDFVHALSFLPHPPSLVKDNSRSTMQKKFWKRRKGFPGSGTRTLGKNESAFQEQNLDGCLGGF
ncbi:hypothetical protein GYMLUDRAFT_33619 [Collybiopsis luxurians FD-317 M1]|nr:hypothetical protein GYMLUDRAFT_33619 [Collybiopsis luxurians FD-317 M1]